MDDLISRQAAIDALWKALYEYEDKTEKQFQESEDLDVGDWILHREFVQNMSDIDRRVIIDLPSVQPERWIPCSERLPEHSERYLVSALDGICRRTTVAPYHPQSKSWSLTGRMTYWKIIAWMPLPEPYNGEQE